MVFGLEHLPAAQDPSAEDRQQHLPVPTGPAEAAHQPCEERHPETHAVRPGVHPGCWATGSSPRMRRV